MTLLSLPLLRALQLVTNPNPIVIFQPYSLTFNRVKGDLAAYTLQLFLIDETKTVTNPLVTELSFEDGSTSIVKDSEKDSMANITVPK
jgi:hypothetical protein